MKSVHDTDEDIYQILIYLSIHIYDGGFGKYKLDQLW